MARGRREKSHTPVMQQFLRAKEQYPDAIVFFRLGDFYEMFFEDAVRASGLLDITLTSRGTDPKGHKIPMAGVPHHAAAAYLSALLRAGEKVAICEQMAEPSTVKGVVPREVVRVVTPGLCVEPDALDASQSNHLVAVGADLGLCVLELSTASLRACAVENDTGLLAEALRLEPAEMLVDKKLAWALEPLRTALPATAFRTVDFPSPDLARQQLTALLGDARAHELTDTATDASLQAIACALDYAAHNQPKGTLSVHRAQIYDPRHQLVLDEPAVRNLELLRTLDGEKRGSLLHLLDLTKTPMGARMLRHRLLAPLTEMAPIRRRHDAVEAFLPDPVWRDEVRAALGAVGDLERLATRIALELATPRDLGAVRDGLQGAGALHTAIAGYKGQALDDSLSHFIDCDRCDDLLTELSNTLSDSPPIVDRQGGIFASGVDDELDRLRQLSSSSKDVILELERRERDRTGIGSLKVKFTRVFGYYIEVTRSKLDAVPQHYVRKQTVANAERFITQELSELQDRILNADERSQALELSLFHALRERLRKEAPRITKLAHTLAAIDVAASWAQVSHQYNYVRPEVDDTLRLRLEEGRHPIVERLAAEEGFVPNDVDLHVEAERLMMLTGPNMSGKSTAMRQVALSVIMAQSGGFVPAARAHIGIVDRVFTRVGASDNLSRGQSTFMVEMKEAATILREATRRSLVILDEVGRGTSTYDGLAIAWAVTEHLHDAIGCRTMFATHYHELCELADTLSHGANFNVAAEEHRGSVVFLHKLVRGGANRSYGISVAQLAGVPPVVLARAKRRLRDLEEIAPSAAPKPQMKLFEPHPAVTSELRKTLVELDIDSMTPVDALVTLARLKAIAAQEGES